MNNTKKAPCAVSAEGRTNIPKYTPRPADADPSHPANLLPSLADHLLLAAFGEAFGGLSARTVRTAQELALTIVIQAAACTREPIAAWRAMPMASASGRMLAAYARLSGDTVVVGGARECRELRIDASEAELGVVQEPPLPGTVAFNEMAVAAHLRTFARHAREHRYDATMIVQLACAVEPPLPMAPWSAVARGLGVIA